MLLSTDQVSASDLWFSERLLKCTSCLNPVFSSAISPISFQWIARIDEFVRVGSNPDEQINRTPEYLITNIKLLTRSFQCKFCLSTKCEPLFTHYPTHTLCRSFRLERVALCLTCKVCEDRLKYCVWTCSGKLNAPIRGRVVNQNQLLFVLNNYFHQTLTNNTTYNWEFDIVLFRKWID